MESPSPTWQYPLAIVLGLASVGSFVALHSAAGDILGHLLAAASIYLLGMALPPIRRNLGAFPDSGTPSLRSLALITPPAIFIQILLGAGFRHNYFGFTPHLMGALFVSALLLYVATGVLTPAPPKHATRLASTSLLWATLLQVLFGIAAFMARYTKPPAKPSTHAAWAHLGTGAITFGIAILLSALLLKSLTPQETQNTPAATGVGA